jgi:PKD repeat protein
MKPKVIATLFLFVYFILPGYSQPSGGNLFDISVMHEVRIEFDEPDFWNILLQNFEGTVDGGVAKELKMQSKNIKEFYQQISKVIPSANEDKVPYLDAKISIDGVDINTVGVRFKGFSSYWASPQFKKSMKIDLNAFVDTANYFGIKKFNLNNGVADPSLQRDAICYELMRKAGVAAPRTSYAKLYLNNVYWGLFLIVEQVDKTFLEDNFASDKGDLYKNIGWTNLEYKSDNFEDYYESIALKTNEETSNGSDYVNLVKTIDRFSGQQFFDSIQKQIYIDYYLKVLSIDIITKNWDSYIQHGRNFYLYHEPVSNLIYWIPWDYNLALDGQFGGWGNNSSNCGTNLNFTIDTVGTKVSFHLDTTGYNVQYLWWDFGDYTWQEGDTSLLHPVHTYIKNGIYTTTLGLSFYNGCYVEVKNKVILIDTAGICPTALTMSIPYFPNDTLKMVYNIDDYCCNCGWDNICNTIYNKILSPYSNSDDPIYPIDYYSEKLLLSKIMSNSTFKSRYFDIFKFVLDSVFVPEQILEFIDMNAALIRDAVYADTNYAFTTDNFEYDIDILCQPTFNITSLKRFLGQRKSGLEKEYSTLNYYAKPVEQEINIQDIVINELTANNVDDADSSTSDWIELYNRTNKILSLKNFALSDNPDDRYNWVFPDNTAIMPDGYVIIWADDKDKKNNLHATFKLSSNGEQLILSHKKYGSIDSVVFDIQPENKSFARFPNGTGPFTLMEPTFNRKNVIPSDVHNPEYPDIEAGYIVYPNPADEYLTVQSFFENIEYSVQIFNLNGQLVISQTSENENIIIDLNGLANGLYIVELVNGGKKERFKLVVSH